MIQHITVVYYTHGNGINAFHVINANKQKLQNAFNDHDVSIIKNITIEKDSFTGKEFKTIFTGKDIQTFLNDWNIDFL
jgi:hypothetical protein